MAAAVLATLQVRRGLATSQTWPTLRHLMSLAVFMVVAALSLAWGASAQQDRNAFMPAQSPNRQSPGDGRASHGSRRLNPTIRLRPPVVTEDSALVSSTPDPAISVAPEEPTGRAQRPLPSSAPIVRSSNHIPSRGASSATRGSSRGSGDIVFPENEHSPQRRRPNQGLPRLPIPVDGPPACARNGATYCEDVDDYPAAYLAETLENTVGYTDFFGNDSMPQPIGDRIGGEMTLCPSVERLIFPKMAQNKKDEWYLIVNLDDRYQQGVRVEKCQNETQKCLLTDSFPENIAATCRQKYVYRKLLAVGADGEPQPDSFRLPSCCACFVDNAVLSRAAFGLNNTSSHRHSRRSTRRRTKGNGHGN